jgi:hypothetical protein
MALYPQELRLNSLHFTSLKMRILNDFKLLTLKTGGKRPSERWVTSTALRTSDPSACYILFICIHFKTRVGANKRIFIPVRLHNCNKIKERCSKFTDDMQRMNLRGRCVVCPPTTLCSY